MFLADWKVAYELRYVIFVHLNQQPPYFFLILKVRSDFLKELKIAADKGTHCVSCHLVKYCVQKSSHVFASLSTWYC